MGKGLSSLCVPMNFMSLIGGHETTCAMIERHIVPNWAPCPLCKEKMSPDNRLDGSRPLFIEVGPGTTLFGSRCPPLWIAGLQVSLIIKFILMFKIVVKFNIFNGMILIPMLKFLKSD